GSVASRREGVLEREEVEERQFAVVIEVRPQVARGEEVLEHQEVEEGQLAVAIEVGATAGEDALDPFGGGLVLGLGPILIEDDPKRLAAIGRAALGPELKVQQVDAGARRRQQFEARVVVELAGGARSADHHTW